MSKTTLTSVERVNRMMTRQDQDRIPRHDTFWPDTLQRWERENGLTGGERTVLERLEGDMQGLSWMWPACFPGQRIVVSEDEETQLILDDQGKTVRYWKHKSGTPEHVAFGCETRELWESKYKPSLLANWRQQDPEKIKRNYEEARARGKWTYLAGVEGFEETRSLMGDETTLIAMAEDPEWVADVATTFTDVCLRNLDLNLSTGIRPDGLWIYGDMAFRTATMCSPSMYKELIWPHHKRLVDWAHSHGMKFIYHTDGDINGVMDLYVEAGIDCIQPLESKASMDIRKMAPNYGQKISFFGNIDVMKMITNDMDVIEEEIATKFAAGMANKNYCYHSDHSVPPQVSWETYQGIIRLVEKYGYY